MYDEDYTRKVYPHLNDKGEEFFEGPARELFCLYSALFAKYNKRPTMEAMLVGLQAKGMSEDAFEGAVDLLKDVFNNRKELADTQWLVDETESFCKDKSVFNAIYKSISIIEGNDKQFDKNAIPKILEEALAIAFDQSIGSDYLEDWEKRFEYYTNVESTLKFPLEALNILTNGGLPPKTLSAFLAGCVHPDTKITIRRKIV